MKSIAASLILLAGLASPALAARNVVAIIVDDLSPGATDGYPLANLAQLAREGLTLTTMYASHGTCHPSRAGAEVGRYQQRFGIWKNPPEGEGSGDYDYGLPGSAYTLGEAMQDAGLRTGMIGKWHIGPDPEQRPERQGYDESAYFLGGGHKYYAPTGSLFRNGVPTQAKKYLTDWFADEAVAFIDRNESRPFYLSFRPNAPHDPIEALATDTAKCPGSLPDKERQFCGMLVAVDRGLGRIMDALDRNGLSRNTLVWYTADNGCQGAGLCDNGILRGAKGSPWEGGTRVPGIVWQPGVIPAGDDYGSPVSQLDMMPTLLAAVDGRIPGNLDGDNVLRNLLQGTPIPPRNLFFAQNKGRGSVRRDEPGDNPDQWKFYKEGNQWLLYNLRNDPDESTNVAGANPDVVADLRPALQGFLDSLPAPQ